MQSPTTFVRTIGHRYHDLISDLPYFKKLGVGLVLFIVSLVLDGAANIYVALQTGPAVHDLILDHIPTINVEDIYLEGFFILLACIIILALHRPKQIPFMLKTIALFISIRSFFIILTHLSIPLASPAALQGYAPTGSLVDKLSSGNDLFFSFHTGLPFLLSLMFWERKWLRITFLATSILFGAAVLLGHVHYSIDVFGAYFITYSIFHMGIDLFKGDYALFVEQGV